MTCEDTATCGQHDTPQQCHGTSVITAMIINTAQNTDLRLYIMRNACAYLVSADEAHVQMIAERSQLQQMCLAIDKQVGVQRRGTCPSNIDYSVQCD